MKRGDSGSCLILARVRKGWSCPFRSLLLVRSWDGSSLAIVIARTGAALAGDRIDGLPQGLRQSINQLAG